MKVFVSAPLTENLDNGFLGWIESLLKEAGFDPLIPHHYHGKLKSLEDEINVHGKTIEYETFEDLREKLLTELER